MQDGIKEVAKEKATGFIEWIEEILNYSLVSLGDSKLTIGLIFTLIISFIVLFIITEWIRRLLVHKVLSRYQIESGTRASIGMIVKYVLILAGCSLSSRLTGLTLVLSGYWQVPWV